MRASASASHTGPRYVGEWAGEPPGPGEIAMNKESVPADKFGSPRREPRLPPGQVKTDKWPVLHYGSVPRADLGTWELRVDGLVENPQRWTWDEFQKLPRVQVASDIHCVTRWSRY